MNKEGHSVSPVLWHSLDVWQVVRGMGPGQEEDAITDLLACSTDFNVDNWLATSLISVGSMYMYIHVILLRDVLLHQPSSGLSIIYRPLLSLQGLHSVCVLFMQDGESTCHKHSLSGVSAEPPSTLSPSLPCLWHHHTRCSHLLTPSLLHSPPPPPPSPSPPHTASPHACLPRLRFTQF